MAELLTTQDMVDGRLDVQTLKEAVNEDKMITPRIGQEYASVPMASRLLVENGLLGATPFSTYASMTASNLADGSYAVVTNDTDITKNGIWQKLVGVWIYIKYNIKSFVNQKSYLLAGELHYQSYDKANDAYTISHGDINIMLGSGRGFATITAANKITVPRNRVYYIDLNGIKTGDTVVGIVTTSDWASPSNGMGAFVEDTKLALFSYRTNGLSGRLVNSSVKQQSSIATPIWFKSAGGTKVTFDTASRTLSWSGQIVLPSAWRSSGAIALPAHSITFANENYQVAWLDLREIIDTIDITTAVKISKYSDSDPFISASYQVPIYYYGSGTSGAAAGFFSGELASVAAGPTVTPDALVPRESQNAAYFDAGIIKVIDANSTKTIDITPNQFLHGINRVGKGISAIIDKPTLTSTTSVIADNDGYLHPSASNLLTIIPVYGQSNGTGYKGTDLISQAISSEFDDSLFMFAGTDVRMGYSGSTNDVVVDMSQFSDFQPMTALIANGDLGVTANDGFAQFLAKKTYDTSDLRPRIFTFTASKGGQNISGLQKGSNPYTNLISAIARAQEIALSKGWLVHVPCVIWVHGEADSINDNYDADLITLLSSIDADVKVITNQLSDVQLLATQPSSFYSSHAASLKMIDADANNANIHLINPSYMLSYSSDFLHYTSNGHFENGEYFAKAYRNLLANKPQRPLKIITVTRVDANTLDIKYDVVHKPLVIDSNVIAKDVSSAGFEVYSNGKKTIASAAVINQDTVRLITSDAMIMTGIVRYALQGQESPRTLDGIPRGRLRDSDITHNSLIDNKPLYNWAVHQSVNF